MKKLKLFFTALLLLCCLTATAHDFEAGGIYYNILSSTNKTVKVTYRGTYSNEYNEYTGSVVIPKSVTYDGTTYSVTSIGWEAFRGCTGLTSITILNSVTSIENYAFYNCSGLTSVVIDNSVTSIGEDAFDDTAWYDAQPDGVVYAGKVLYEYKGTMPSNTSITIKDGTLGIAGGAFNGCTGLTSITIPNSVTSIGEDAFDDTAWYDAQPDGVVYAGKVLYEYKGTMPSNTSITIKDGTLGIAGGAFNGCTGLTSITIPNSVTSIGNYVFDNCRGLKELFIGDGEKTLSLGYNMDDTLVIGQGLFYDCPLETLYLGRNLSYNTDRHCGYSPFYKIPTLTSVTMGNSVTSIGNSAFDNCKGLTSVEIPNSVTSIGERAFLGCSFTNIVIPAGARSIGRQAFGSNRYLTVVTSLIPAENLFEVSNLISMTNAGKKKGIYKLYVPIGAKETYEATAGWNEFSEIIEVNQTSIDEALDEVKSESGKVKTVYYDLNGRAVENPANGIYILNGKKVLVK